MEVWWLLSPSPAALLRQPVYLTSLRFGLKAAVAAVWGERGEVKGRERRSFAALHEEKFSSRARAVETLGDSRSAAATF